MNIKSVILLISILFTISLSYGQQKIEITTVLNDNFVDKNGNPLTGRGVVIGDVDSGIDIFHPMFFFADGGSYDWIDVNGDGKFSPGIDGIDLNNDGVIEKNEMLKVLKLKNDTWDLLGDFNETVYNPQFDFLYLDQNSNGKRDFGPSSGFTENDPGYGEPMFIPIDTNLNGKLDPGEKLVMLKTSKVRAVREKNGNIRRRGIDLIYTEPDSIGHGTGVAGILLGGHRGVEKIQGIAPDAEIVVADIKYDYTPRFVRNFPDLVSFLKDEKINILLFEDGEWMWEFMDGSTLEEELVNQMARDGIPVVGGAGNFATGNMMLLDNLGPGQSKSYKIEAPKYYTTESRERKIDDGFFASVLWTDESNNLSFTIETPDGDATNTLSGGGDFIKIGKYDIAYAKEISTKGTVMFKFGFSRADSGSIEGTWAITIQTQKQVSFRAYCVDVSQSWEGSTRWYSNKVTGNSSITFPSTADSIMAIGAYVVNFGWFDRIGDIANYSSRGYNLDGKLGIEICAPGHTTFTTEKDFGWSTFSGTSSAATHVVGTIALMLQYDPSLTQVQIKDILRKTATKDNFTGNIPNPIWGYGKLNKEEALRYLINNIK